MTLKEERETTKREMEKVRKQQKESEKVTEPHQTCVTLPEVAGDPSKLLQGRATDNFIRGNLLAMTNTFLMKNPAAPESRRAEARGRGGPVVCN